MISRLTLTLCAIAIAIVLSPALPAGAMTVSPMHVEMTSVGQRNHARVTVVNNSNNALPIEAVVHRLTLDETGKPTTVKAGEDFLIMPPQAMIPAGGTQNFRVQWLGDPLLARSESFLLYLNQVPVKAPKGQIGVQVVMSMGVMINVAPAQGAPALKVVSTGVATDKSGKRVPTITVENPSNMHALMPQSTVSLAAANWSTTLQSGELGNRLGIGLVQPGQRRTFTLPVELPAGVSKVKASVDLLPTRR